MKTTINDVRGVRCDPFNLPDNFAAINPVSWECIGEHENGFFLKDDIFTGVGKLTLIRVEDNKIIEAFRLQPLEKGKDIL